METTTITMSPTLSWVLGIAAALIASGVMATLTLVLTATKDIAVIRESFAKREDVHELVSRVVRAEAKIEALDQVIAQLQRQINHA